MELNGGEAQALVQAGVQRDSSIHLRRNRMRSHNVSAKTLRAVATLLWLAALILVRTTAVYAQQNDDLQQQVKQLKQEYEQVIADLQKRIAALEQKAAEQKTAEQKKVPT